MPTKQVIFALVIFFHDLFTAVWVGGLITLGMTVLPSARKVLGMGPQTQKLVDAIQSRLSTLVYVSIVGLWVTGVLLSRRALAYQGLFSFANAYSTALSLKHIAVLLMVAVALLRSSALSRLNLSPPSRNKLGASLLMLNIVLGIAVLSLSGFSAALSAGTPPATIG